MCVSKIEILQKAYLLPDVLRDASIEEKESQRKNRMVAGLKCPPVVLDIHDLQTWKIQRIGKPLPKEVPQTIAMRFEIPVALVAHVD